MCVIPDMILHFYVEQDKPQFLHFICISLGTNFANSNLNETLLKLHSKYFASNSNFNQRYIAPIWISKKPKTSQIPETK